MDKLARTPIRFGMPFGYIVSLLIVGLLGLSGCKAALENTTPRQFSQNPSNRYTLSVRVKELRPGMRVFAVVNGRSHLMHPNPADPYLFEYDCPLNPGQESLRYYFTGDYSGFVRGQYVSRQLESGLFRSWIESEFVLSPESDRGPVGAQVAIWGQGFNPSYQVHVGTKAAPTRCVSATHLSFTVPEMPEGRYPLTLQSGQETIALGDFSVDRGELLIQSSDIGRDKILRLQSGQTSTLLLTLSSVVPAEGVEVTVTTNLPEGIFIEPVLVISPEQPVLAVELEAGRPGKGNLYLKAPGFRNKRLAVEVLPVAGQSSGD